VALILKIADGPSSKTQPVKPVKESLVLWPENLLLEEPINVIFLLNKTLINLPEQLSILSTKSCSTVETQLELM